MADFPSLPLWTDAYLGDTRHLSQAEHGAYLLLLITAWRTPDCCLPDDDRLLAKYACCDMRTWHRQKSMVMAFWNLEDGQWTQKRLSAERKYVAELSIRRAEAGARGGRARAAAAQNTASNKNNVLQHSDGRFAGDKRRGGHVRPATKPLKSNTAAQANLDDLLKQNSSKTQAPTPTPSLKDKSFKAADAAPASLEKQVFDLGKPLLGSGGQVKKLVQHFGGDLSATKRTLELAATKSDPREYVGAILKSNGCGAGSGSVRDVDASIAEAQRLRAEAG